MSGRMQRRSRLRSGGGGILASLDNNVPARKTHSKEPPKTLIISHPDEDDAVSCLDSPCSTTHEEEEQEEEEVSSEEEDEEDSVDEESSEDEEEVGDEEASVEEEEDADEFSADEDDATQQEDDSYYDPEATDTEEEPDSEEEDDLELADDDRKVICPLATDSKLTQKEKDTVVVDDNPVAVVLSDSDINDIYEFDDEEVVAEVVEDESVDEVETLSVASTMKTHDKPVLDDENVETPKSFSASFKMSDDIPCTTEEEDERLKNSPPVEQQRGNAGDNISVDLSSNSGDNISVSGEDDNTGKNIPKSIHFPSLEESSLKETSSSTQSEEEPVSETKMEEGLANVSLRGETHQYAKHSRPQYSHLVTQDNEGRHECRGRINVKKKRRSDREGIVKRGQWKLGSKIGNGAFGVVHVGMNMLTGTLMAVKSLQMERAVMKDVRVEIELLKSMKHVNIVRYLGAEMDNEHLHIFQEWVPGGSVTSMLSKFGAFSLTVVRSYLLQILEGLAYLHDLNIMHRDIKGSNILVNDEGIVKLADFGASKKLQQFHSDMMFSLTMRGTPYFMAPEVFEEKYSAKADVWSVGCVAVQMATGSPPWRDLGLSNPVALFQHLERTEDPPKLTVPSSADSRYTVFQHTVSKCFLRNAVGRPSARELLTDPFFTAFAHSEDELSESMGLFSPSTQSSWEALKSPMSGGTSPARRTFERRNSAVPSRSLFMSPPLPKRGGTRSSPGRMSPQPDPIDWPTWARHKHHTKTSPSLPKVVSMMDSLAFSDDTGLSASGRVATLCGLKFVKSPEVGT